MTSGLRTDQLLAEANRLMHVRNYSARTRVTYLAWIRRFLTTVPAGKADALSREEVERFIERLTSRDRLAPKSRNQASSALAFLFREVLGRDELRTMRRAKEPKKIPVVLSHRQTLLVLGQLSGKYRLLGGLMYGAGLRLSEAHRLRVRDIDLDLLQISIRDGKGGKDRWVVLPDRLVSALIRQIDKVRVLNQDDRGGGGGWAALPHALARKDPTAGYELAWQYLFPASRQSEDPMTGKMGRFHLHPSATQREVKRAGRATGIPKSISCHTFRRSFATQMLRAGYDVRTVQKLMGHRDVRTTMIYVEAVSDTGIAMRSPLDRK